MSDLSVTSSANPSLGQGSEWADWAGMTASIGCAIHCAAMPFIIAYLPVLGLSFLADEAFHKWMAAGCFLIALTAFIPGLRKHGRLTPVATGSVGLVMILVAAFGFAGECCPSHESDGSPVIAAHAATCSEAACPCCASDGPATSASSSGVTSANLAGSLQAPSPWGVRIAPWLTPLGGLVLVSAHLLNRRYRCLCGYCSDKADEECA